MSNIKGGTLPLWQLNIGEVTGHNLEVGGREEVNRLLNQGWRLLHIYGDHAGEKSGRADRAEEAACNSRPQRQTAEAVYGATRQPAGDGELSLHCASSKLFPILGQTTALQIFRRPEATLFTVQGILMVTSS